MKKLIRIITNDRRIKPNQNPLKNEFIYLILEFSRMCRMYV